MIRATLLEGLLYVVCVGPEHKEQIVSSGSYFAHGKYLFDRYYPLFCLHNISFTRCSEEQRAAGFYALFQKLSPETQLWWTKTYPETIKPIDKRLFTPEEVKTRWWYYSLATHPDHQRRGYAAAIMDSVFEEVKRAGSFMGVVPATEVNVKIYTSMGFKEIGSTLLPSPAGDCEIHVMTRGR